MNAQVFMLLVYICVTRHSGCSLSGANECEREGPSSAAVLHIGLIFFQSS